MKNSYLIFDGLEFTKMQIEYVVRKSRVDVLEDERCIKKNQSSLSMHQMLHDIFEGIEACPVTVMAFPVLPHDR